MKKNLLFLVSCVLMIHLKAQLSTTPFASGNLVIGRFNTTYATSGARKTNILEVTPTGTIVQNFDLPFTGTNALTLDNVVTIGALTLSGDGKFVSLVGFNVDDNGTNTVAASDVATTRIVGVLNQSTTYTTYKMANSSAGSGTTDPFDATNIRSAYTTDGTKFYVSGGTTSTTVANTNGGVWYFNSSDPIATSVQITPTNNTRFVIGQGNTLYSVNAGITGTVQPVTAGIQRIGDGTFIPETAQTTTNLTPALTGTPTGLFVSPDGNYAYVGKNSSTAIEKWKNTNGTWALQYTIAIASAGRSLTAKFNGDNVEIYSVYAKNVVKSTDNLSATSWGGTNTVIYTETDANIDLRGISFTPGTTNTGIALPVTFGNIVAKSENNQNIITWNTFQETNVNSFELQRSTNAITFNSIASILPKGSNSSYIAYDNALNNGNSLYYRIKVNNINGNAEYSKTVTLKSNYPKLKIQLSNPSYGSIRLVASDEITGWITILDNTGKTIATKKLVQQTGNIEIQLPKSFKGLATIKIITVDNKMYTERNLVL